MPRESTEAMGAVTLMPGQRPEAPKVLTLMQAQTWKEVVATKPSNWFTPDNYPMLIAYCQHISYAATLADKLNTFPALLLDDPEELKRYDTLAKMLDREHKQVSVLATKMRLTQLSKVDPKANANFTRGEAGMAERKPWDKQCA